MALARLASGTLLDGWHRPPVRRKEGARPENGDGGQLPLNQL